nr:G5 domain-containing protein [uncultured Microbacterium sp.]
MSQPFNSVPPASQPSGAWHPDPQNSNQLRWWDGHQWTNATMPSPAAAVTMQVPMQPPASVPPKRRTGWRNLGIIAGAIVVGGLLARLSPIAIVLVVIAVIGIAIFVLIAKPLPALGLRSRPSGLVALGMAALLVTGGGIASASTGGTDAPNAEAQNFAAVSTATPTPRPTPTPTPTTFDTVTEEVVVPYVQTTADDPLSLQGTSAVTTVGVNGVTVITYRVTLVDGVEVAREVVSETVKTAAVNEVTSIGSKVPPPPPVVAPVPLVQSGGGCDPNYTGACVPISSDVDCAGGSGNGPAYVQGPVQIVGSDIYDLDRDGDGIACD